MKTGKKVMVWLCGAAAVGALALTITLAPGCNKGREVDESKVIARVGDAVLTVADLERMDEEQRRVRQPSYLTKKEIMEDWVKGEVIYQNALEQKVDEEAECARRLSNARKAVVVQRFWELNVYDKYPELSKEEALKWFEENKEKNYKAKKTGVWIRRILLNSREKADEVMRRLREGEDFTAITKMESVSPEKLEGGSRGYRQLKDLSPVYRDAVAKMKEGSFAGPFKLATFYVIIKLEDRVEPGEYLKPEGIGIPQLRDKAKVETWRSEAARIGEELKAKAHIEQYPERIPEAAVDMARGAKEGNAGTAGK